MCACGPFGAATVPFPSYLFLRSCKNGPRLANKVTQGITAYILIFKWEVAMNSQKHIEAVSKPFREGDHPRRMVPGTSLLRRLRTTIAAMVPGRPRRCV